MARERRIRLNKRFQNRKQIYEQIKQAYGCRGVWTQDITLR